MMYSDNGKISNRQLKILILLDILSVSVITLPKFNAEILGNRGWLLPIGAAVFLTISLLLISSLAPAMCRDSFLNALTRLMGRPLAALVCAGLIIKLAFALSNDLRIFSEAAKLWLLPGQPLPLIAAVTLIPCFYGSLFSYETRARLSEIFLFIVLIPFAAVFIPCLFKAQYHNLFSNFEASKNIYIKGSLYNCLLITGPEFLLLSFPYIKNPYKIKGSAVFSAVFAMVLITIVCFTSINLLGASLTASFDFPGAEIMDTSFFSKGKGAVMMSFFYLSVVIFAIGAIFFGGELLSDLTRLSPIRSKALISAAAFALSLIPKSITELFKINLSFNLLFAAAYMFALPLLLNLIIKFKKDDADD